MNDDSRHFFQLKSFKVSGENVSFSIYFSFIKPFIEKVATINLSLETNFGSALL